MTSQDFYAFHLFIRLSQMTHRYFYAEKHPYDTEFEFVVDKFQGLILSKDYTDGDKPLYDVVMAYLSNDQEPWVILNPVQ